jgi:hypothetical protein
MPKIKNWIHILQNKRIEKSEFIQNFSDIYNQLKKEVGKENFSEYKRTVHNLPKKYNKTVHGIDLINLDINKWLNPDTMSEDMKLFFKLTNSEDIFGGKL